jgi:hypothetical protein
MNKKVLVPTPQQMEIKFTNHLNGRCTAYYKEITEVASIELAKKVVINTKIFFEATKPKSIIKVWRKGNKVIVEDVMVGEVNGIVFGLIMELLAQTSKIDRTKKLMVKLMKELYTKKELNKMVELVKKNLKIQEEKKHARI